MLCYAGINQSIGCDTLLVDKCELKGVVMPNVNRNCDVVLAAATADEYKRRNELRYYKVIKFVFSYYHLYLSYTQLTGFVARGPRASQC